MPTSLKESLTLKLDVAQPKPVVDDTLCDDTDTTSAIAIPISGGLLQGVKGPWLKLASSAIYS